MDIWGMTYWDGEARYHFNGMPANMAAVLRDQYRRAKHEGRFL